MTQSVSIRFTQSNSSIEHVAFHPPLVPSMRAGAVQIRGAVYTYNHARMPFLPGFIAAQTNRLRRWIPSEGTWAWRPRWEISGYRRHVMDKYYSDWFTFFQRGPRKVLRCVGRVTLKGFGVVPPTIRPWPFSLGCCIEYIDYLLYSVVPDSRWGLPLVRPRCAPREGSKCHVQEAEQLQRLGMNAIAERLNVVNPAESISKWLFGERAESDDDEDDCIWI